MKENIKDKYYDFNFKFDIPGVKDKSVLFNPEKGKYPWYARRWLYILLTILAMGWL